MFLDEAGEVLYVGKAKNLKRRVSSYFLNKTRLDEKTKILVSKTRNVKTINVDSEIESLLLEANYIKKYTPRYNLRLTDDKRYPSVKISLKDKTPSVLVVRKQDDPKSIYFGPYPSSSDLRMALKLIRRIFPYQSVSNHPKRFCLYHHLGLCPCPPMFTNPDQLKQYKRDIAHIIQFFKGERKQIVRELEEERDTFSKNEQFEEAFLVQKKIDAINAVSSPQRNPFEYEQNPDLRKELRNKEITQLLMVLKTNGLRVNSLNRIECYDISNITGKFATGSMVVFTNGEKDSASYRRFKIKRPPRVVPNDFAMMREVIKRRLAHSEWRVPNLIIVDGGKGQISSAQKALFESEEDIPLIGIAKREEILITSDFEMIRLPKNSPALILVRRIRDEAHRFAITYHKKLRAKYMLNSLHGIGVGEK